MSFFMLSAGAVYALLITLVVLGVSFFAALPLAILIGFGAPYALILWRKRSRSLSN